MFLGDKGKPTKYSTVRLNYDIIIDNEKFTLQKMTSKLCKRYVRADAGARRHRAASLLRCVRTSCN